MINAIALAFMFLSSSISANDDLEKYHDLIKQVSKYYSSTWQLPYSKVDVKQKLVINLCKAKLRTYWNDKLIFRDIYDLSETRPRLRKSSPYKTNELSFGIISLMKRRSSLHFNDEISRLKTHQKLKEIYNLCNNKKFKSILLERKNEDYTPPLFEGKIPLGRNETRGEIQGKKDNNWIAPMTGETSFLKRLEYIKKASRTIDYQTLDFSGDPTGIIIADELIKKRAQGLEVNVLVDGLANLFNTSTKTIVKNTKILYNNMMASGIRVFGYSCKGRIIANEFRGIDLDKLLRRAHEKFIIFDHGLDEQRAIMGGINTNFKYFRSINPGKDKWRDYDIAVSGNIVSEIGQAFKRNLKERKIRYKYYKHDDSCLNPYNPLTQQSLYLDFKKDHTKLFKTPKKEKDVFIDTEIKKQLKNILSNPSFKKLKWFHSDRTRFILARPEEKENYIYDAHVDLIRSAKKEIIIANQFFIPDEQIKSALRDAANRGVKIKIITNSNKVNTLGELMVIVGRWHYIDIILSRHPWNSGQYDYDWNPSLVEVYEFVGKEQQKNETEMGWYHTKMLTIDGHVTLIGSYNLDYSSQRNSESSMIIESRELTKKFNEWFKQDIKMSEKVPYDNLYLYRNPPRGKYRFKLRFAKKIEHYL